MKAAVCELDAGCEPADACWEELCGNVRNLAPDLFLLNEMPFGPWISSVPSPDVETIRRSQELHRAGMERLGELETAVVLGSRPFDMDGKNVNQAFIWSAGGILEGVHTKQFFPDEEEYYEARWFQAGPRHFRVAEANGVRVGFLICTEVMFNEQARHYGRAGAHILAVPRATGSTILDRWLVAMRMAAIVSGCYVLSSNRRGRAANGQQFGGKGWIIDPTGTVIAETSAREPVVCAELDLQQVAVAQRQYPCYVAE